jgi:Bacterial Ig-like domain/Carboxypeptidase regulatory-like domain
LRASPASIVSKCALSLTALLFGTLVCAQTPTKIGSLDLSIGGLQATVTPSQPVIPKNIASGVQIVVSQNGQTLAPAAIAQYLGGPFQIVGEFSGPGLTQTVDVPQSPPSANSLIVNLPAMTTAGDYTLSNLRFLVNGQSVLDVSPSTVTVKVIDQVLVTSVQTQPLTLDQIQAMGVVLGNSDYTGFQFTVGLQLSSQVVNISFPVVFDGRGVPVPLPISPPALPPLSANINIPLPTIVPILLQSADGSAAPTVQLPDGSTAPVRIPSVLVIPGNVGYLKQFFSAQLYVSNGAPGGSNLSVRDVTGTINLPPGNDGVTGTSDDPLSLPDLVSGPETATLAILAPGPDGKPTVSSFNPGQTGQAQWTIRGDKEGFQTINFDIAATLDGLPTGSVALKGTASGGVLVRNPYFNITFSVPGVVRKGELFNVFATVTNTSQVAANNLTVNFDNSSISGVTLASGQSPVIPTLNPGDSTTLTYQFQSLRTGQVVASYLNFDTQNGTTGGLHFALGVYANGTPMSPDTLVLPSSVDNLPTEVVDAAMRVLGQAWSVATASNTLPAGVISTSRTVVTQKALALAESGLRQSLGETLPNALRDLATDFWGGSTVDPGFDQVLRTTPAGQNFAKVLGAHLAQPATQAGGASPYELQVAQVLASAPNFITVGVGSGTGPAPVSVTLTDGAGNQVSSDTPGGTILGGVLLPLGSSTNSPVLGLLTSPTNSPYTVVLTGQSNGTADISISIPRGDGTVERALVTNVTVVLGQQMRVVADLSNPNNLVLQVDSSGDGAFATSIPLTTQVISPAGPNLISATVIGPETVSQAGKFGLNLVALFDRIVDFTSSAVATSYSIPNNTITSASRQLSGRLVFANLAQPEGPYVPQTFAASGIADQRGITGPTASVNMQSRLQDPGAVVTGRVLGADGNASPTATVNYSNTVSPPDCSDSAVAGFANVPVRSDGIYQYRYVHQDQCGGPFQMSTKDPQTGAVRSVSAYVRAPGQQMVIDLALLGLGSVAGKVLDLSGNPVPSAQVVAVSGTDPQIGGRAFTDGVGNYTISGITVGPVTVTAVKGISLGTSAGNIERAGTTAVVNVTMNGGAVQVSGTVTQLQNGTSTPVPGLPVVYYVVQTAGAKTPVGVATTAADGSFTITGMPTGSFDLVAAPNSVFQVDHAGVAAAGDSLVIRLEIVLPTTGTVNGKVTLPGGSPAAGVVVFQNQNGVLSNADGTFSLSGVPVRPSQSQTISARTVDGVRSGQTNFVLNSGTTPVNGANITLSGLGSAQFTVLDATGHPVPGQKVVLIDGFTASGCGSVNQTTDVNGRVTFTGLPIGTVSAAAILSRGSFTDLALGSATIAQDGTTGFATMQFNGSGTVTGNVVDANKNPALGAVVQLTSKTFDSSTCSLTSAITQSVQTDVSGNFRFTSVNVGQVGVTASNSFFPTQVGAQGNLPSNGATVNFSLQLVNSVSGVLSGTVYLPNGTTAAGSGIQVTANGPLPDVTVNTDGNGFFKFAKIFPEGLYTLTANDPVSGGVVQMKVYLRAGQDTKQDLRLKGTGTINVSVVDGAGAAVSSAFVTLTETDYPNETFDGSLDASNQGVITFPNVFEGGFSVQVKDSFARGGRASGTLPQSTPSLNVQVQLTTTGTIQGHFYLPDGFTVVPNGIVQLTAAGRVIGQATTLGIGDVGWYSFEYVPAGPVELKAQDPLTGRTGIAAGSIDTQGQVLSLNVRAQGLDTVQGLVTSNGSAQPGASVTVASNNFQATTLADANGMYLMNGVPEGVVTATASLGGGFLSGTATSPVNGDGTILTLNIALRNSGTVTGKVVQADGVTPSPSTSVSISVGGTGGATEATITDAQGSFSFERVPAGSGTISAQVLGGFDQGVAFVSVPPGSSTSVQVTLNGVGALSGHALDSSGNPTAGTIVLTGTGTFPYSYNLTAASDGTFSLPQVLAGPFTAKLSANIGGVTLYGTATGSVTPNQTANVSVQLQPSGTIRGLVVRPDGQTPAVGANVSIQLAAGGSIALQAQNDGSFAAIGVPLGTFTVRINDPLTSGLGFVLGQSVGSNGQTVDLGTITLDNNALSVVASNPSEGATGIGVSQPLTVTFSEALSSTNGIYVTNGASNLSLSASLSGDGKTVTLQGQMPDGVLLILNVTAQVIDVFGRQLLQPQTIHFTTTDLTPPVVVAVAPANQAIQVPVNSTVAVTFNKALSTTALPANVITLGNGAVNVPGTSTLSAPNVLTFTPSAPLSNNAVYTVTVSGAVSFGGNVQTAPFSSMFISPETTAPVLQLNSPASGAFVGNARPTIAISLGDSLTGINVASATLVLDGQLVTPAVGTNLMSFTPASALAEGTHTFTASVQNNAGILGTLSSAFVVDTAPPSVAALTGITAGQVLKGQVSISASATDSVSGINHINLLVDGVVQAPIAGPIFSATLDTTHIADGRHNFTVQAVNNAGTSGPVSAAVQAFVENVALSVSITSPAVGAPFKTQVVVTAVPSEPVQRITFSLGTQTVTATASPYQGTLSLAGVADGPQIISVTAYDFAGDTATSNVAIVVMQTPPPAPNANLIFAEPPNNGVSLVHGLPGAVTKSGLVVTATDTATHAVGTGTSANDGSFAESLTAAVNDTVSLTATDVVGNVSAATLIAVRQTPSLPASSGSTSLFYQGKLVDRVGLSSGSLVPDGQADAVFTLSLSIGSNITRTLSYITLQGGSLTRSTQAGSVPLGVAADAGSPLMNSPSGPVSFPITTGATLTLFAGDGGFIQPGTTYTATAVFTDGSQFVGTYTIVAPADLQYVAHSATITANPATVVVNGSTPGTTTLTITNIKDINGTTVPDGAMIALSAANMASLDPTGNGIISAGGAIVDGTPAANNTSFKTYTIQNGTVTANYSSQPVTPTGLTGALAVIQMQAADANGNVLGTEVIATLDLNIRASTDQAIVGVVPASLYGDKGDHRSHFTIQVRNSAGNLVPDGTPVLVSAASCASLNLSGSCLSSVGGQILGGQPAVQGQNYGLFTVQSGSVQGDYSSAGISAGVGQLQTVLLQVIPSTGSGSRTSTNPIGTAQITIAGAGSSEIELLPNSVPYVFPVVAVPFTVHHLHDLRANIVPNGSTILVSAANCAAFSSSGSCIGSAGGTIADGTASPSGTNYKYYTLTNTAAVGTYTIQGATAPQTGQSTQATVQVLMSDAQGNRLDSRVISTASLKILGPANAIGFAQPANIFGDGGLHTSTVTFNSVLDVIGNPLPDGSNVLAAVSNCAGFNSAGSCVGSAGGQILNGTASPAGSNYKVLTILNGGVSVSYGDQNITSTTGQISTANVMLLPSDGAGNRISTTVIGVVPVGVAGLTSASGSSSPGVTFADGGDHRTTITLSNLRDASGQIAPDGTVVAASARNCFTFNTSGSCVGSAGGQIVGSNPAPFDSSAQLFTVANGQIVFPYSSQGVSVGNGEQTATVQVRTVTTQGSSLGTTAVATIPVQLLAPGSATVSSNPATVLADGVDHRTQIVLSGLVDSDGSTPVPDGAKVAVSVVNCAAFAPSGSCISSAGGAILSAGTSPGDGTTATNNSNFKIFTVAGGTVQATYSDLNVISGVNQIQNVGVSVVAASTTGSTLTSTSFAIGTIQLPGMTSATSSGPTSLSVSSGGNATVTFSGLKDANGNSVPDGSSVAIAVANCASFSFAGSCNSSVGGTIVDGTVSSSDSRFRIFTVTNGAITVTYSTTGASVGTAVIQALPAKPDGTKIGSTSLIGGVWAISITN